MNSAGMPICVPGPIAAQVSAHFPDYECCCGHNGVFHGTEMIPIPERPGWITLGDRKRCTFCGCRKFRQKSR